MKSSISRLLVALFVVILVAALLCGVSLYADRKVSVNLETKEVIKNQTGDTILGENVELLLSEIIENGPKTSSNPNDYIKDSESYKKLVDLGNPAKEYMLGEFSKSNSNGLKENIMAIACNEISGKYPNINIENGREWYYKYGVFDEGNRFEEIDADYDLYDHNSSDSKELILPKNLDKKNIEAVIDAYVLIKNRNAYLKGEKSLEAHKIYRIDKGPEESFVYLKVLFLWYEFQNGNFTVASGGSDIVRMKVKQNNFGEYEVTEYKRAMDGGMYVESIRQMFPKDIADQVLSRDTNVDMELSNTIENEAKVYVKSLNRDDTVVKSNINRENYEEGINKALYAVKLIKPEFPDRIGTREALIKLGGKYPGSNTRCVFETKVDKTGENEYLVTLTKKWDLKINGEEVTSTYKYKYVGDKLELIEENDNDGRMRSIK